MHPIAFRIGSFVVYWYGILLALGFLVGWWTASRRSVKTGINPQWVADIGVWLLIGGIAGARLFYVVEYWHQDFANRPFWHVVNIREGGLVFYGGLFGGLIAGILFVRRKKIPLWRFADVLAPSIPLGHAFGRMGCFLNGCCYGKPTTLPWGVRFPAGHPTGGIPVHPTELYELVGNLLLYALLARLYRRKRFDGQVLAAYLVGYGTLRFLVEFFRGDYKVHYLGGWATIGHIVSFFVVIGGVILWRILSLRFSPSAAQSPARENHEH